MRKFSALAVAAAVLLLAFCFQGSRGVYAPDEGFYIGIAKGMMDSGDFIVPRLNHDVWLDKPPLTMWMSAAGMMVAGQNEWGARAFQALCYALTALFVFLLGQSMGTRRQGLMAALIYATMLIPFGAANVVTPDTPLALWIAAAYYLFWNTIQTGGNSARFSKVLLGVVLGLGFLTKGPATFVCAAPIIVFLAARRNLSHYLRSGWTVAGLVLFAAIGLSWYASVSRLVPGSLSYIWDNQVWGRTVSSEYNRNPGLRGAFIYLPTLLLGGLPWSLTWFGRAKKCRESVFSSSWWSRLAKNPADLLLVCWIVCPVLVFALASSKLPLYVLPVFPALAIVTARAMAPLAAREASFSKLQLAAVGMLIVGLLGLKLCGAILPCPKDMRALSSSITPYLPGSRYEIVSVDQNLEGLCMYQLGALENATTSSKPYKFFVKPERLEEEVLEMNSDPWSHLYLIKGSAEANLIRKLLAMAGCSFREHHLPYGRVLVVCDRGTKMAIAHSHTCQHYVSHRSLTAQCTTVHGAFQSVLASQY